MGSKKQEAILTHHTYPILVLTVSKLTGISIIVKQLNFHSDFYRSARGTLSPYKKGHHGGFIPTSIFQ